MGLDGQFAHLHHHWLHALRVLGSRSQDHVISLTQQNILIRFIASRNFPQELLSVLPTNLIGRWDLSVGCKEF